MHAKLQITQEPRPELQPQLRVLKWTWPLDHSEFLSLTFWPSINCTCAKAQSCLLVAGIAGDSSLNTAWLTPRKCLDLWFPSDCSCSSGHSTCGEVVIPLVSLSCRWATIQGGCYSTCGFYSNTVIHKYFAFSYVLNIFCTNDPLL